MARTPSNSLLLVVRCFLLYCAIMLPCHAAEIAVDTLSDVADGDISSVAALIATPGPDGHISLREVILATNATPGPDTITFAVSGTISTEDVFNPLPPLSDPTGGTTVSGLDADILLSGQNISCGDAMLELTSPGNVIELLSFTRCWHAVRIRGSGCGGNSICGCVVDGTPASQKQAARGIYIEGLAPDGAHGNIIGGTETWMRNVIIGCHVGIWIIGGSDTNVIQGNYIGLDESGSVPVGNQIGIDVVLSRNNIIGGVRPEERNVFGGNRGCICVADDVDNGTIIQGNSFGLDAGGTSILSNLCGVLCAAPGVRIGGSEAGASNVFVGNERGIIVRGDFGANGLIQGNYIGTDPSGTLVWEDGEGMGVSIEDAYGVLLGGAGPGEGNVIAGNPGPGVYVREYTLKTDAANRIQGNTIGLPGLGNAGPGILIEKSTVIIGGTAPGEANTIAHNGGAGIEVAKWAAPYEVLPNAIYDNGDGGIRLLPSLAEHYPAPLLTALWPLRGEAAPGVWLRVYADDEDEGRIYLGTVLADGEGRFSFNLNLTPYIGMNATATATWEDSGWGGSITSEFSAPLPIAAQTEGEVPQFHSADQNQDGRIDLSELLRVIQLYNVGAYQCGEDTEDGYAPGPASSRRSAAKPGATACTPHSSDYNPQDWVIDISELLRLVQFYNSDGSCYYPSDDSEDGYWPCSAPPAM